jgi:hypothetical protein
MSHDIICSYVAALSMTFCTPSSPSDFSVVSSSKKVMKSQQWPPGIQWFQKQSKEFVVKGIHWLVAQWHACLSVQMDHF